MRTSSTLLPIALAIFVFAADLCAQATSTDYEMQRWRHQRMSRSGAGFGIDLGGSFGSFDFEFSADRGPLVGTPLTWEEAPLNGPDTSPFWRARMTMELGWDSRLHLDAGGGAFTLFEPASASPINWGDSTIPASADLDVRISLANITLDYRHDLFAFDPMERSEVFLIAGFSYDLVRLAVTSDAAPVSEEVQRMSELLPLPLIGLGWTTMIGNDNRFTLAARYGTLPNMDTFQSRDGEDLDQDSTWYDAELAWEYRMGALALTLYLRYQHWEHELVGATIDHHFEATIASAGAMIGLRF